jgi:hypothetical protein
MTEYGFRYDPMKFVESDDGLQGAQLRTFLFDCPREGDAAVLKNEIDGVLAEQKEDGSFGDSSKSTGSHLLKLLRLGIDRERDEVKRAADAILRQMRAGQNADEWYEKDKVLSIYALHALCLLDRGDEPEVPHSLKWLAENPEEWNRADCGCPWTPEVFWSALWAGREVYPPAEEAVNDGLRRITAQMNDAGCCLYNDPWGFTDAAGEIDSPEARALVEKQVPMILRGQRPTGGWRDRSFKVMRALKTHGLLDALKELPALPPDWKIGRELPIPEGKWFSLTWDGENFWSVDHGGGEAVSISSTDGSVLKRLRIENCGAVAWWDGALACVGGKPKELKKVDPGSGEVLGSVSLETMHDVIGPEVVAGKVLVGDGFNCCVSVHDPQKPEKLRMQCLAGPGPACMAADGEAVWHADYWAPGIIKSDLDGRLLEWGDQPVQVSGLAHDGEKLWALDKKNKRICSLEKVGG